MDLQIDNDVFEQASNGLKAECEELRQLLTSLEASFEQLHKDWDSDAGRQFFSRFETDLLDNLNKYIIVFEHMSCNLSTASQKYEEVFRAANAVLEVQL